MIIVYAVLKKAAAIVNYQAERLEDEHKNLVCQTCDEILAGQQKFVSQPGVNNGIT
jgi:fumarate hydratase, class II